MVNAELTHTLDEYSWTPASPILFVGLVFNVRKMNSNSIVLTNQQLYNIRKELTMKKWIT